MAKSQISYPYGVGISAPGIHGRTLKNPAYRVWCNMLSRCFDEKYLARQPTYKDCTICSEWLEFQIFADWYENQKGAALGWELDKDLLSSATAIKGNLYSPETCLLLPKDINRLLQVKTVKPSGLPTGVFHNTNKTGFIARCISFTGVNTHLGTFLTIESAKNAYIQYKKEIFKKYAEFYKNDLAQKAYSALNTINLSRN